MVSFSCLAKAKGGRDQNDLGRKREHEYRKEILEEIGRGTMMVKITRISNIQSISVHHNTWQLQILAMEQVSVKV